MLVTTPILAAAAPAPVRNLKAGRRVTIGAASDRGRAGAAEQSDAPPRKLIQSGDKLAFTIDEAVQSSTIGETSLCKAIKDRRLIARKFGTRSVILRSDLIAFLENLPVE